MTIFLGPLRCRCGELIAATKGDWSWHNSTRAGKLHGMHECRFTHRRDFALPERLLFAAHGIQ